MFADALEQALGCPGLDMAWRRGGAEPLPPVAPRVLRRRCRLDRPARPPVGGQVERPVRPFAGPEGNHRHRFQHPSGAGTTRSSSLVLELTMGGARTHLAQVEMAADLAPIAHTGTTWIRWCASSGDPCRRSGGCRDVAGAALGGLGVQVPAQAHRVRRLWSRCRDIVDLVLRRVGISGRAVVGIRAGRAERRARTRGGIDGDRRGDGRPVRPRPRPDLRGGVGPGIPGVPERGGADCRRSRTVARRAG